MAKISRYGGPSDANAVPGEVRADASGRISSAHPDEQGVLPLWGEPTEVPLSEREEEWPGPASTQSPEKRTNTKSSTKATRR